jgi:hypothetical protein
VARIEEEMRAIVKEMGYNLTLPEFIEMLRCSHPILVVTHTYVAPVYLKMTSASAALSITCLKELYKSFMFPRANPGIVVVKAIDVDRVLTLETRSAISATSDIRCLPTVIRHWRKLFIRLYSYIPIGGHR